ncbi:ribonuclease III domain-containing protein [Xylaria intraflava]|nr:ribonuclease III domain-containing protein [Xylaria intraflava]
MPRTTAKATAVFAFQLEGWAYQPPEGDQTCLGYLLRPAPAALHCQIRCQSTTITPESIFNGEESNESTGESSNAAEPTLPSALPSPDPTRALRSAKLAALHARLSLSSKIPVQTLARALIDPSADPHPRFNNTNLAFVGASVLQFHTSEFLVTRFPRLPMAITYAAMKGYAGDAALHLIARSWGVEPAASPGESVDPGYLQYSKDKPTQTLRKWGYVRAEAKELVKYKWRRGLSSRVVYDDAFGETVSDETENKSNATDHDSLIIAIENADRNAHANFVRAVIGAVYMHCGAEAAKTFVKSYVLARQLDLSNLFNFKLPQRELSRLCDRENFDPPVARLLSETGRMSRTPVFVVGIYSGLDQLGEAAGPSLQDAKIGACINALKAWYLYSPGDVGVPSDTLAEDPAPWKPAYVDIGEIVM